MSQDSSLTRDAAMKKAQAEYSIEEALKAAQSIQADVQAYNNYAIMETRYEQEGINSIIQ
jgi:hypothetical protein